MANGNAKTGKYQALRRRKAVLESRLAQIVDLEEKIKGHHDLSLLHRRTASQLRAELSGLIKLGFSEGPASKNNLTNRLTLAI